MKNRKRLAHDVSLIFADFVDNITNTDCWAQNAKKFSPPPTPPTLPPISYDQFHFLCPPPPPCPPHPPTLPPIPYAPANSYVPVLFGNLTPLWSYLPVSPWWSPAPDPGMTLPPPPLTPTSHCCSTAAGTGYRRAGCWNRTWRLQTICCTFATDSFTLKMEVHDPLRVMWRLELTCYLVHMYVCISYQC